MHAVGTGEANGLLLISRSENQVHFSFLLGLQIREECVLHKVILLVGGTTIEEGNWREIVVPRGREIINFREI